MKIKRIFQAIISLAVVIATLMAVSCGETIVPTGGMEPGGTNVTSGTKAMDETPMGTAQSSGTSGTKKTDETHASTEKGTNHNPIVYSGGHLPVLEDMGTFWGDLGDVDMGSKILIEEFVCGVQLAKYYSKIDGEMYVFCFDPLCDHRSHTCIANMLSNRREDSVNYYLNNRLYFIYDNVLYSCSNIATDLRKEFDMSENIEMFTDNSNAIGSIFSDGISLLIELVNSGGRRIWYRYDTSSRKMINTQEYIDKLIDTEKQEGSFLTAINGKIVYNVYNVTWSEMEMYGIVKRIPTYEEYGTYITDSDFKDIRKTETAFPSQIRQIFNTDDYIIYYDIGNGRDLLCSSKDTFETTVLIDDYPSDWEFIYLRDRSLYYMDYKIFTTPKGVHTINSCSGEIYRYDLDTGESTCVYKNDEHLSYKIIYLDDDKFMGIIIKDTVYNERSESWDKGFFVIKGDVDENGNFVNVRIVDELE
ncbi:MAG: hypothetical protein KBS59_04795 [Clostridiales bacterium]|nr:hypothetical protein [Clostridiales bacterium]